MTVKNVIGYLEDLYPLKHAEPWDHSGLNVKFKLSAKITSIILAIDLTTEVLDYAISKKANLIITHHPFIFSDSWINEYQNAPYKRVLNQKLKEHQINVYSLHTNYDVAFLGTSHQVFKTLGLNAKKLRMIPTLYGVVFDNPREANLVELIAKQLNIKNAIRTNFELNELNQVERVVIFAGSGLITDINKLKASLNIDLVITSDLKWNEWINYQELGIKIIEIPHLVEEVFANQIFQDLTKILIPEQIHIKKINLPYKNLI